MENSGKSSIRKRTKHINIRFFVTDSIQKLDMSVEWCPTDEMTRNLLKKSNQGSIFKRFRDLVVGVMPQIDPNNGKQDNIKKNQTNKSE